MMLIIKGFIAMIAGGTVGLVIWEFFGAFLRKVLDSSVLADGINGLVSIFGGVITCICFEKVLGMYES